MKIAVLSGKGGTGKTTVATSLVSSLPQCQYIDCDVEEPNGYIFLHPQIKNSIPVYVPVPEAKEEKCDGCGYCGEVCQFNAIAVVKNSVLVFPEICHHCGACMLVCPHDAIYEVDREVGVIESNASLTFLQGKLKIGEPISIPIIKALKERMTDEMPVVLDCSPGASCTVVQSIDGCDYCLLVAEPTPFGVHDLTIAVKLVQKMGIPCGVVINKSSPINRSVHDFCAENDIEILLEIPFSRDIAQAYSNGILPTENSPLWRERFRQLYTMIERGVSKHEAHCFC
ncbi:MAG: ATP-binding protein [Firmicutes bacterium]|nr:ATP-binding protein [Bacillota bacterium]